MAALESEKMKKARALLLRGAKGRDRKPLSAYAVAIKVGITPSAIYAAPWYKEWRAEQ